MVLSAVCFGSIGTLVETSEAQRSAFNTALVVLASISSGAARPISHCSSNPVGASALPMHAIMLELGTNPIWLMLLTIKKRRFSLSSFAPAFCRVLGS